MGPRAGRHAKAKFNIENLELSPNLFEFKYVIGKGGFGKVWKVLLKKTNQYYALKEMSKAKIIDKKSEKSIRYERDLLAKIKHPFIVNMNFAFQDKENLYLVMDLLTGGDLRYHITKMKTFTEEQTKFFVCCIVLGLEYLHRNNVIHRDIKPENLVLDEKGYVRITDFGIAKIYQKDNSNETSGTPGYMSPEVILGKNHNCVVDYFALGVITYEFMMGKRPYNGKGRREIKEKIISKQIKLTKNDIPYGWSSEAAHFINGLLQRKPANRLGLRGALEVKENAWLKYYPWKDLYEKKVVAPFIPSQGDNFDQKYCDNDKKLDQETKIRYDMILKDPLYKDAFVNFTFFGEYTEHIKGKKPKKSTKVHNNNNSITGEFINPHIGIKNYLNKQMDKTVINLKNQSFNESIFQNSSLFNNSVEMKRGALNLDKVELNYNDINNVDKTNQLEKKIIMKKQQLVSSSVSTLLRGYKRGANSSMMFNSSIVGYIKHDNGNTNQNINEGQNIDVEHDDIIDE